MPKTSLPTTRSLRLALRRAERAEEELRAFKEGIAKKRSAKRAVRFVQIEFDHLSGQKFTYVVDRSGMLEEYIQMMCTEAQIPRSVLDFLFKGEKLATCSSVRGLFQRFGLKSGQSLKIPTIRRDFGGPVTQVVPRKHFNKHGIATHHVDDQRDSRSNVLFFQRALATLSQRLP